MNYLKDISKYVSTTEEVQHEGPFDIIVGIVPTNIIQSMAEGNMLAIIFFSVIFGLGVAAVGDRGKPVLDFFQGCRCYVLGNKPRNEIRATRGIWFNWCNRFQIWVCFTGSACQISNFVYATMLFFIFVVLDLWQNSQESASSI